MISVTKLRNGVCYSVDNTAFKVLDYKHTHMSRGGGTVRVKVRNLTNGAVATKAFKSTEKVDDISVEKKKLQYLYKDGDTLFFMDPVSFAQIEVEKKLIGDSIHYLKEGEDAHLLMWDDKFLDVDLPVKIDLKIADAAPGEKGDSASNVYKDATLENGLTLRVPLFIKPGDMVRVDTRSGEYVERVS